MAGQGYGKAGYFVACAKCNQPHRAEGAGVLDLIACACRDVSPKTDRIYGEFAITDPDGRWDYDGDTGLMTFTDGSGRRSRARFYRVGTWLPACGSFKWHWAHDGERLQGEAAAQARAYGEAHGIELLTQPMLWLGLEEVWHLTRLVA